MNNRTITAITAAVLLPVIALTAWAYIRGHITYAEYLDMWREPVAIMLGFWVRGEVGES